MQWMHRNDRLAPAGKAARSLDFPIALRVRGSESPVTATLLQLGLGGVRLRTWRIMQRGESIRVELPRENGDPFVVSGRIFASSRTSPSTYEYTIDLDPLDAQQEDILAREAAALVRRRTAAA